MVLYSGRQIPQNLAKLVRITPEPNNINQHLDGGNEREENERGKKKSNICLSLNYEL